MRRQLRYRIEQNQVANQQQCISSRRFHFPQCHAASGTRTGWQTAPIGNRGQEAPGAVFGGRGYVGPWASRLKRLGGRLEARQNASLAAPQTRNDPDGRTGEGGSARRVLMDFPNA